MHAAGPATIHATAIVDPRARLSAGVDVGPYCVIEGRVEIGPGTIVSAHSVIRGHTVIGASCRIGPAAYVGMDPQHLRFDSSNGETSLVIGDEVIIRETATLHRSMRPGFDHATRVGDRCFVMAAAHVGHDCRVGNDVVLANAVLLAGHATVGERAFLGGGCAIHQFCRIGRLVIVRGLEAITRDVPPFGAVMYDGLKGYNAVGCRRAGIGRDGINAIRAAYQCIHTHRTTTAAVKAIRSIEPQTPELRELLDFIASTKRGIQPSVHFLHRVQTDDGAD